MLAANTLSVGPGAGAFAAGEEITLRVDVRQPPRARPLRATPAVARAGARASPGSTGASACLGLLVTGVTRTDALVDLPYEVGS